MKKGDLSLSTSAIVTLIIAVIVLGLIVTFIVRGFGSVDEALEREASRLPDPQRPTSMQPITISTRPSAEIGGDFLTKVSIYNPCNTAFKFTTATLACTDSSGGAGVEARRALTNEVQPGQTVTVTFIGSVTATTPGRSLCSLEGSSMTFDVNACAQFVEAKASVPIEFVEG